MPNGALCLSQNVPEADEISFVGDPNPQGRPLCAPLAAHLWLRLSPVTAIDDSEETVFTFEDEDSLDERADDFFGVESSTPVPAEAGSAAIVPKATAVERLQERRLRARKVRRLVRHVEPWSVLKVSLLFFFCIWVVVMVAGVLLWNAAVASGVIGDIENFTQEIFAFEDFQLEGDGIFRATAIAGLVLSVAATGFSVLLAILLNLISDLTGGIRITVVEEETARPISTLPRRG